MFVKDANEYLKKRDKEESSKIISVDFDFIDAMTVFSKKLK